MAKDRVEKKTYRSPQLEKFGSVGQLTLAGFTNPGEDTFGGSVNPPGLGDNPGLGRK